MSGKTQPKERFSTKLSEGDFLSFTIWPGKSDPTAEVINVQIRRQSNDGWITVGKLAVYRTADGRYSQLPERRQTPPLNANESEES